MDEVELYCTMEISKLMFKIILSLSQQLHSDKPLPVMVYIHGGAFKGGDSTRRAWSPDYLMWEEVIYISIGYRLGQFGEH